MTRPKEIIVIGGNAAGPAAAAKAKRVSPDSNIKMFEAGEFISTGTCEIPYVLSGEIENYKKIIFYEPKTFYKEKGVEVYIKHRVLEIDKKNKEVKVINLNGGEISFHKYDKLIITTGSKSKKVNALSVPASNLFNLNSISDLVKINDFIESINPKSIAIIGSGYIGLEVADAFYKKVLDVTLVDKNDNPLHRSEIEIQHLIKELLNQNHIRFFGGVKKLKANYSEDKIVSITIEGRILEFDMILVSAGFEPNSDLAREAGLEIGEFGGIKVDARLKTSDPHIYAAGDCIEIINEITGRPSYIPLASIAHDCGHIAGENAAGGSRRILPVVKNISVKIFDKYYISVGLSSVEAKKYNFNFNSVSEIAYNLPKVMKKSSKVYGKIIYENESKKILGASFLGDREVSGYGDLISALIRTKQPGTVLSSINYNYTPPLSPHINLLSLLGRKIK